LRTLNSVYDDALPVLWTELIELFADKGVKRIERFYCARSLSNSLGCSLGRKCSFVTLCRRASTGPQSAKLLKNGKLETHEDFPHGMRTTQAGTINAGPPGISKSCRCGRGRLSNNSGQMGPRSVPSAVSAKMSEDVMQFSKENPLSRRRFCLCCAGGAAFAATGRWLAPGEAFAEARGLVSLIKDSAAVSPIVTHTLRENISVFEGSGGNVAVLTGPDGKVLIDAGISVSRPHIVKALADLGPDPVTHLINTHWHFDHTDGNAWLNSMGAKIIAQENTRKYISEVQRVADWGYNFLPQPPGGVPSEVFATEKALKLNGSSVSLKHYGPAHTDSDISVTFDEADIVHVADTFWNGVYPFIDYSTGGSIDGMIAASDANLAVTTDNTIIIPGHGHPVSNKAELKGFRDMLVAIRANVSALKKQGRSRDEAVAAKPTAAFDAQFGNWVIDPGFFTRLVYEGV
jgi:glyoxylase-like metal-dependent hydrolase (beta-lactamase superfamily II)